MINQTGVRPDRHPPDLAITPEKAGTDQSFAGGLQQLSPGRNGLERLPGPAPGRALLRQPGCPLYSGAHRQRCLLPLPALPAPVPAAEAETPSDQAISPRTNGKAERFIQTALREWAYARSYGSSEERGRHLPAWLHQYNWHRPHASLDYHPPVSRLGLSVNNLMGLHS